MTEVVMDKAAITTADPQIERTTIRKVALRLMWFVMAMYFLAILDRGNISFAPLQMNKELGLNAEKFGIAAYVTNALDDQYVTGINNLTTGIFGTPFASISEPRMWGVEATVRF